MGGSQWERGTVPTVDAMNNLKQDPNKISLLLDLPPELRNKVYECHLEDKPHAHLSRFAYRPELATTSNLVLVSKQVRKEFLGMLYLSAPIICTAARNFDFRHVVTYLNRLSDLEMEKLKETDEPPKRQMRIVLDLTDKCKRNPEFLGRWVRRVEHPTKRGTEIDFQYAVAEESYLVLDVQCTPRNPAKGSRSWEELRKIRKAVAHELAMRSRMAKRQRAAVRGAR